jgi:hypothetical protein
MPVAPSRRRLAHIFGRRDSERVIDVIAIRPRGRAYR